MREGGRGEEGKGEDGRGEGRGRQDRKIFGTRVVTHLQLLQLELKVHVCLGGLCVDCGLGVAELVAKSK